MAQRYSSKDFFRQMPNSLLPPPRNPVSSDTVQKGLRNQAFFFLKN